jgi:type IV pilus assembly protein PilZ
MMNDDQRQSEAAEERPSFPPSGQERRAFERSAVDWSVDYHSGDTFLYSYITNISAMGIFVYSRDPLPVGTRVRLMFAPPYEDAFELAGQVTWVNPFRPHGENLNPGMGVRFMELAPEMRERLVQLVRTIAYLPDEAPRFTE